jgi:choline-glycine betaine transporter
MKKNEKNRLLVMVIVILVLSLFASISYIVIGKYQQKTIEKEFLIYQQGAKFGYEQAIMQLFKQTLTCQSVPIRVENQTINIIAIECFGER